MPANDLSQSEMSLATEHLLDEARPFFEDTPYLAHLIAPTESLMQAFVDDQADPQAEAREAAANVQAHAGRFDDQIRALDHFLLGFALLEPDPARRARIEHAHAEVLPDGRQLVNRSAGDKAAEARLMDGRLEGDVHATLDNLWVARTTLLSFVRRDVMAQAELLGDAQAERLAIESRVSRRTRGYNLTTRRRFLQLESGVRALLDIHGADDDLREGCLGFVDRLIGQAERRAAARRLSNQGPLAPPAQAPIAAPVDAPGEARSDGGSEPAVRPGSSTDNGTRA